MANSESSFKQEIKRDLERWYGNSIFLWANSDKFRSGIPDQSISWNGCFFGIESKYVDKVPANSGSKILRHPLKKPQRTFLENLNRTGNFGRVLIGFEDVAVICMPEDFDDTGNTTKSTLLSIINNSPWKKLSKTSGRWGIESILEDIVAKRDA